MLQRLSGFGRRCHHRLPGAAEPPAVEQVDHAFVQHHQGIAEAPNEKAASIWPRPWKEMAPFYCSIAACTYTDSQPSTR